MRLKYAVAALFVLLFALIPLVPMRVSGQSGIQPRITQAIDNTKLTTMRGNVNPKARAEFDRGAAPATLPMDHMLLVLTRSADQQSALDALLAQQQDRSSVNYHKWLTPEEFGQQFGPSDQDVQKITAWLQSQGFQVSAVSKGHTTIDFSGNAGQVQQAFHTSIHSYVFASGEQHWSNSTDPQIPTALAAVVAGVNSLNNFPRKPMSHSVGVFRRTKADGKVSAVSPNFTYPLASCGNTNDNCYAIGPADFDAIYNVPATINGATAGSGETIAIVSDSDINTADLTNFRTLFGLPTVNFQQIETGADPGVQPAGDEIEADLDAQWAGAVAPGAQIDLVVSETTNATFGGDTSAQYIVNNNLAAILGYSYGECELELGTAGNTFYNQLWSQAASQGITVLVSTGDSGSAGCDPLSSATVDNPAQLGLAVNGVASTPYTIAVGGTDFNDFTTTQAATYFNSSNTAAQGSAKGYIPETTYNDSCTNSILYIVLGFTTAEAACNSSTVANDGLIYPAGGSGGVSNCTTNGTTATALGAPSTCSGGYAKPSWQTGPGVPNDGKRDVPDLSLFSGDGTIQNFYIICQADQNAGNAQCNLSTPYADFEGIGGTSVAAEAFAGVMALIDQKTGSRQGIANPTFYALAAEQSASSCNSTSSPASTCTFYDVTSGTIAMPCLKGSPNCTVNFSSDANGVLSGYNAGTGYDLATGLGSVNVGNLINNFGQNFYLSSSSPVVTVSSPGASGTMAVTAYPVGGYTGTVTLSCSGLPTGATCSFSPSSVVFTAATSSTTGIPVTVTVNTTTASMTGPGSRPELLQPPMVGGIAIMFGFLLIAIFASARSPRRGWSTALALVTFALLIGVAACGGGGSSGTTTTTTTTTTTGATGSTTAALIGTPSTGAPVSSMTFTVTIQ